MQGAAIEDKKKCRQIIYVCATVVNVKSGN